MGEVPLSVIPAEAGIQCPASPALWVGCGWKET